jgi:hypothetical protein
LNTNRSDDKSFLPSVSVLISHRPKLREHRARDTPFALAPPILSEIRGIEFYIRNSGTTSGSDFRPKRKRIVAP